MKMETPDKTERHRSKPTVTGKYHIEVPLHQVYSTKCVFKVSFGKRYYIGKAKALLQSCESMATIIERALRTGNYTEDDLYYHVITYIKQARVLKGVAQMIHDGSDEPESDLLKIEQQYLNKAKNDPECLNNNFDAYIPKWIPIPQVLLFNKWKNAANKNNKNRDRATNSRKKHKG